VAKSFCTGFCFTSRTALVAALPTAEDSKAACRADACRNTGMQIYQCGSVAVWHVVAAQLCLPWSTVFTHNQKSHGGHSGPGSPPLLPVRVRPHLRACLGAAPGAGIAAPRPCGAHCD